MSPTPSNQVEAIAFHDWLRSVIEDGEAVLPSPPSSWSRDPRAIARTIGEFARLEALELAGPPLQIDHDAALWAAEFLASACWELVAGEVDPSGPNRKSPEPKSPSPQFCVDLFFRFLPKVLLRAKALHRDGPLQKKLEQVLARWPLSGVLTPGAIKPAENLDFFGHVGLMQLYGERFFLDPHPAWLPQEGATREWIELIFAERGAPLPFIPDATTASAHE